MLKLFVFPTDRNSRLCKFFIVTILFLISVLLACPSGHAFEGPGLYKDGEKVIGFDRAPSDEADIVLNATATKTMAEEVDRKRRILPENMADADNFHEQKNYIKTLLECKELVTTIKEKLEQGNNAFGRNIRNSPRHNEIHAKSWQGWHYYVPSLPFFVKAMWNISRMLIC